MYLRKLSAACFSGFLLLASLPAGCAEQEDTMTLKSYPIEHELEFGGVYIKMTIDDFLARGFQFGDSVRVEFSNGSVLEDIPFYDGYYVPDKEPLLVGYPGYPYIKAAYNNGDDLWETASLNENVTATVSLNMPGKYLEVMNARSVELDSDRAEYESDEAFASFRSLKGGNMKENVIFRSSSPCDDTYGRARYADDLAEKYGVRYMINLSDTPETLENHLLTDGAECDYTIRLNEEGKIMLPQLNTKYETEETKRKIAEIMREICRQEGPFLIHCSLGKDRTGFICMLLEMLAGADYDEIIADYMITYDSFYHVTETGTPEKYETIVNEDCAMLISHIVTGSEDPKTADCVPYAEAYLREGGMTDEELSQLKSVIME